jgi:anti-anti-sigma regulatory factor/cell division protein FtsB
MYSEALDITIDSRGSAIRLILAGPFTREQVPQIRAKIEGFIRDGHRNIVIDLEQVASIHESAAPMFLSLLNSIKGKGGDIKFIFKNSAVSTVFVPYKNLFTIYPDVKSLNSGAFLHSIRRSGMLLTKKTGIRLSFPVALFLLFILTGWFISIAVIISMQRQQIQDQQAEIRDFEQWKKVTEIEINDLRTRVKPMIQLGLVPDSLTP